MRSHFCKVGGPMIGEACPKASMASRPDALGFLCLGISGKVCY